MKFHVLLTALATSLAFASCASHPKKSAEPAPAPAKSAAAPDAEAAKKAEAELAKKKAAEGMSVVCKNAGDQRSLTVVPKESGCELQYLKGSESRSIASAQSGLAHCEGVSDRVQENLQKAGFSCQ